MCTGLHFETNQNFYCIYFGYNVFAHLVYRLRILIINRKINLANRQCMIVSSMVIHFIRFYKIFSRDFNRKQHQSSKHLSVPFDSNQIYPDTFRNIEVITVTNNRPQAGHTSHPVIVSNKICTSHFATLTEIDSEHIYIVEYMYTASCILYGKRDIRLGIYTISKFPTGTDPKQDYIFIMNTDHNNPMFAVCHVVRGYYCLRVVRLPT